MELKNFFAQDLQGNVIPNPTVYMYLPGTGTLATGLAGYDGSALSNPFTGTSNGQVTVAAPDGDYDMRVTGAGRDTTMRVRFIDSVPASAQLIREDLASTAEGKGADLVGFVQYGIGAVSRTVQDELRDFVNVKQFGAVGNGVTDDTIALQNAIDSIDGSGGSLLFPHGTYLTGPLTVNGSWRRFFSTGTAVGLPGAQLKAKTRGMTTLNANMQTVAIENISFVGFSAPTVTGNIASGSNSLSVSSSNGYAAGDVVFVSGAGVGGASLLATITDIVGNTFTLNVPASTTVSGQAVTYDPRGDTGSVGILLQQNGGEIQQDDARITNCWFAGFGEAGIKSKKLQGCHINNCTFEFSGAGIKCYDASSDLIFYQNMIRGCRFYRCLRGVMLGSKNRTDRYLTEIKWNVITDCIFDVCGRYESSEIGQAGVSLACEASYNTVANCQFNNNLCNDIYINRSQGNLLIGLQSHRAGRSSVKLDDADDTVISGYWIDNANSGFSSHGISLAAIDVNESQRVKISKGSVFQYGSAAMLRSINATSNSSAVIRSSNLANGTSAAAVADGSSTIFYGDTVTGQWTPVLASSGGTPPSAYTASGTYSIVGDTVFISCDIQVTTKGSGMSGYVMITGLPFLPSSGSFLAMSPLLFFIAYNPTAGDQFVITTAGSSVIYPKKISNNAPAVELDSSYITSNTRIAFQGSFKINTSGVINVNN